MANITATIQKRNKVFEIQGTIEGIASSVLTVNIIKVTSAGEDLTAVWTFFADANDFEEAIKKAYVSEQIDHAYSTISNLQTAIQNAQEGLENAKRLLINY